MIQRGVKNDQDLRDDISLTTGSEMEKRGERAIRWLRVNSLKWSLIEALEYLKNAHWTKVANLEQVISANAKVYTQDVHIPNLLAFPFKAINLTTFEPYLKFQMIAQDKASCFPAQILFSSFTKSTQVGDLIDATAAPGNKTTHLSGLISQGHSKSKVG